MRECRCYRKTSEHIIDWSHSQMSYIFSETALLQNRQRKTSPVLSASTKAANGLAFGP